MLERRRGVGAGDESLPPGSARADRAGRARARPGAGRGGACQSAAPVTVCTTGTGQATHLGEIRETAVIETSSTPDSCGVAERRTTTLIAADGDRLTLEATGQNCLAQGTASDTYVVGGGTGHYRGATGRGTIAVTFPAPGVAVVTITGVLSSPGSLP